MGTSRFAGRTALVTGGASGIGKALAAALARRGARVTIADLDEVGVEVAVKEIGRAGDASVAGVALDVRDADAVAAAVDGVVDRHGRIDLLFNNAGIVLGGLSHELSAAHWARVIDVNLTGVVNGVVAAYPHMVRQRSGHIVNTASLAGLVPSVYVAAYSASKHGVVGLSGALRPEAARRGVRVSVLCPGAVETPILDATPPPDLPSVAWTMTGREYMRRVRFPLISAETLTARALRGVERNRAVIVVPARARFLWTTARLSPRSIDLAGRLIARRIATTTEGRD